MPDHHNAGHASIARRDVMFASAGFATLFATLAAGETALAQTPPNQPAAQSAPPGTVDVERRGSVLLIGINRPQAQNRFDPPIIIGIGKAYY